LRSQPILPIFQEANRASAQRIPAFLIFDSIRLIAVTHLLLDGPTFATSKANDMENKKVWFITGVSKGLGLTLVKQLLTAGHRVAATSRNTASLTEAVSGQSDAFLPLSVELGSGENVAAAIQQAYQHFGRIDVAVNNAGYGIGGSMEELTDKETATVSILMYSRRLT
jgi:hypothetical protein